MNHNTNSDADRQFLDRYFNQYQKLLTQNNIAKELLAFRALCLQTQKTGNKLIFAGNGASASIASHAATDFSYRAGVRAVAFNDHNLITALGNDLGYEKWVKRAIEIYADPGDLIILISSSGSSANILNAASHAKEKGLTCVTFSGFSAYNPLRSSGDLNLWLDCNAYNVVETIHLIWILHAIKLVQQISLKEAFIEQSLKNTASIISNISNYGLITGFRDICSKVKSQSGKLIFAGNGGSSSIASHAAADFTKQSKIRSVAFNDHNLLTAFANDYGQENWLQECIEAYADPQDAVILISSSGQSANILNAAELAKKKSLPLITMSAFNIGNPLRNSGQINFHADSHEYEIAEGAHSAWTFCVADMLARTTN